MKGSPHSLMLSFAHRATRWWMGHAANALRRGQTAWIAAVARAAVPEAAKPKPPRSASVPRHRPGGRSRGRPG
jgi:hypothetical protein